MYRALMFTIDRFKTPIYKFVLKDTFRALAFLALFFTMHNVYLPKSQIYTNNWISVKKINIISHQFCRNTNFVRD